MKSEKKQLQLENELNNEGDNYFDRENTSERTNRRLIIFLFGVGCFVSIIVGRISYPFIQKQIAEQNPSIEESDSDRDQSELQGDIQFEPVNYIAYVRNGEIVLLHKTDRTKKTFTDPESSGIVTSLAWKNKNELTYSICDNSLCRIKTLQIHTDTLTIENELAALDLYALRWSHKGQDLAYLYSSGDKILFDIKHFDISSSLWTFPILNLGPDFNESRYIRFSPDDSLVLVANSSVFDNESSVLVFKVEGEKLFELKKSQGLTPTFPFFMSNEMIYYKLGTKIYRYSLQTEETQVLTERIYSPLSISPSFDRSKITYFTYDPIIGVTTVWIYEIGSDTLTRLMDNALYPIWLDDVTLILQPSGVCYSCLMSAFETDGLSSLDIPTRTIEKIEKEGDFSLFTSSNQ